MKTKRYHCKGKKVNCNWISVPFNLKDDGWQRHIALLHLLAWLACDWQNEGPHNWTTESTHYWWKLFRQTKIREVERGSIADSPPSCHLLVCLSAHINLTVTRREHPSWCKSLQPEISSLMQLCKARLSASLLQWWITFANQIVVCAGWNYTVAWEPWENW